MPKVQIVAVVLLALGACMIIPAALLPRLLPTSTFWTPEQGREHSTASARLHQATLKSAERQDSKSASAADKMQAQQELAAAKARFESSRQALQTAQFWRETLPNYLRWTGLVFAALGGILFFASGKEG